MCQVFSVIFLTFYIKYTVQPRLLGNRYVTIR
jgi:hypothetical protein